jgi:hypothetical protein
MTLHPAIPTALFQAVLTLEYAICRVFHDGRKVTKRTVNEAFNIGLELSEACIAMVPHEG